MLCAPCIDDARPVLFCCAGSGPVPQQLPVLQHLGPLQRMADVGLVFQFPERHFLGATVGQVSLLLSRQAAPSCMMTQAGADMAWQTTARARSRVRGEGSCDGLVVRQAALGVT